MLPLRFLKWLVLLISLIRATAEHVPRQHSAVYHAPQHQHFDDLANDDFVRTMFDNDAEESMTGNGNALTAPTMTNEIELRHTNEEFPSHQRRQQVATRRLIDWLFWQQHPALPRSRRIEIEALPLEQKELLAPAVWESNASEENSYPSAEISSNTLENTINNNNNNIDLDITAEQVDWGGTAKRSAEESLKLNEYLEQQLQRRKRLDMQRERRLGYPYIPYAAMSKQHRTDTKRANEEEGRKKFLPSISAGAMTHLGNFFNDLSKNVHFNEQSKLGHAEGKLLEGDDPLRFLHEKITGENEANADFLHAIRTYRPSQKIRSLVSMNPRGYHGSQFIDPNYMWVGLGK